MNIFATNSSPIECAEALDDRRLIKMVLETAQLLSTTIRTWCPEDDVLYRPTHAAHPCTVWAMEDKRNFNWLIEHFFALCGEYTYRFGKTHGCQARLGHRFWHEYSPMPHPTAFPNVTPFKDEADVHTAYRMCLISKWHHDVNRPRWTNRGAPSWNI